MMYRTLRELEADGLVERQRGGGINILDEERAGPTGRRWRPRTALRLSEPSARRRSAYARSRRCTPPPRAPDPADRVGALEAPPGADRPNGIRTSGYIARSNHLVRSAGVPSARWHLVPVASRGRAGRECPRGGRAPVSAEQTPATTAPEVSGPTRSADRASVHNRLCSLDFGSRDPRTHIISEGSSSSRPHTYKLHASAERRIRSDVADWHPRPPAPAASSPARLGTPALETPARVGGMRSR